MRDDRFPTTHVSAVVAARSTDNLLRAHGAEWIATFYWRPVYKYMRVKWRKSSADAEDLTQGFFARVFEKDFFESYDPAKARFRTFVRTCVDGFVANEQKAAHRIRRGGNLRLESFDFGGAEMEIQPAAPAPESPEDYFFREWLRNLFTISLDTLRRECQAQGKSLQFALFERYDLDETGPGDSCSYGALAREFNLEVTQVTNYLAYARRELRRLVLENLRAITADETEFRHEVRRVLGVELP